MLVAAQLGQSTPNEQNEAPAQSYPPDYGKTVVLRGVDKATGRVSTFDAPAGEVVQFGTLEITAQTCYSTPPEEPPETVAFLQIDNVPVTGERSRVFSGWMFASSPAVSALEHAVYDVWVIACKTSEPEDGDGNL
jgi:hypothetical protein